MKLNPIGDRLIVKKTPVKEKTEGGIYIPEAAKERPIMGEVLAAGNGAYDVTNRTIIPMVVKVGDQVLFGKYAGQEVNIEGEDLLIMQEVDVLCTVSS